MTAERMPPDPPTDAAIDDLTAPFERPVGARSFEAPRSGGEAFEAPRSGGEEFERPQGERQPFELPGPIPDAEPIDFETAVPAPPPSLSFAGLPEPPRLRVKPPADPKRPWWRFW